MSADSLASPPPPARPGRSRVQLLVLIVLFFAPLALAFAMYYGWHWRPTGQTNHGTLIQPPRPLPLRGGAALLNGRWSLVYIGTGDCDPACHDALYYMRQTYLGLGHEIPRVQQVFLVTAACCDDAFLEREHPALVTLNPDDEERDTLLVQFPQDNRSSTVFIVDPRGNLMMRYDVHARPKGLHDDLVKLLALSHIG
jgi:hypothetical protein